MRRLWIPSPATRSHAGDAFLMLLDIIGSNASRQTTREISYRLVAALALFVTAYSWNAQPSIDSERYEPVASAIYTLSPISRRRIAEAINAPLIAPGRIVC